MGWAPVRVIATGGGAVDEHEGIEGSGAHGRFTVGRGGEEESDGAGIAGPASQCPVFEMRFRGGRGATVNGDKPSFIVMETH